MNRILQSLLILSNLTLFAACSEELHLKSSSVDHILVEKSKRRMLLYCGNNVVKTYKIALGKNPIGHKEKQGDFKTPEGIYKITGKNPQSQFYKSLRISYPNQQDIVCAKKNCVNPGGDIMVHGLSKKSAWIGKAHANMDWTHGCIAVSNEEIDEIYNLTKIGATIEIKA